MSRIGGINEVRLWELLNEKCKISERDILFMYLKQEEIYSKENGQCLSLLLSFLQF